MKNEPRTDNPEPESTAAATASPAKASWSAWLGRNGLIGLLALSVTANASGFAYLKFFNRASESPPSPEVALGAFQFRADSAERGPVKGAKFSLHLAFTPLVEQAGRDRLAVRKYRVQQDIEELLRRAHGADFDDPRLRELKRQILQQINETLGVQAVADVIVTDLAVDWTDRPAARPQTAETAPTPDKPRG